MGGFLKNFMSGANCNSNLIERFLYRHLPKLCSAWQHTYTPIYFNLEPYGKFTQNSSCQKLLTQLQPNFGGMVLWCSITFLLISKSSRLKWFVVRMILEWYCTKVIRKFVQIVSGLNLQSYLNGYVVFMFLGWSTLKVTFFLLNRYSLLPPQLVLV